MTPSPEVNPKETSPKKLHAVIKHQEYCISQQKLKIKALQSQNRRLQNKIERIAKTLEPIQKKIDALKDVNLQAQALIKRQFKKETKADKEEKYDPVV